tara:strand:- start:142 stop:774 length:633 start_codon:yes stop_codon:yes gene_type:complete
MSLFGNFGSEELSIEDGGLIYYQQFFTSKESDELYKYFLNEINWKQDYINMFGKVIPLPRKTSWYGDKEAGYVYSGIKNTPNNWTDKLLYIKKKIEAECDNTFNSLLMNKYEDGKHKLSWHSDDEPELDKLCSIASLSFGSERNFSFKHKTKKDDPSTKAKKYNHTRILHHGSLLIMKPPMQEFWLHQVPASKKVTKPRINLTFRFVNNI